MTDITTAREEIQAQRNVLKVGKHVRRAPSMPGEGCLVQSRHQLGYINIMTAPLAYRGIAWAALRLGFTLQVPKGFNIPWVLLRLNDGWDDSPGLTASQAIAILDEALLVLKELAASLPSPKASTHDV